MVGSLPASEGDAGSGPGLGGSHMPRSDWAREPQLLSLRVWSLCSAAGEAAIVGGPHTAMRSGPRLPPTRESPHAETETQHSQKKKMTGELTDHLSEKNAKSHIAVTISGHCVNSYHLHDIDIIIIITNL